MITGVAIFDNLHPTMMGLAPVPTCPDQVFAPDSWLPASQELARVKSQDYYFGPIEWGAGLALSGDTNSYA